MEVQSEVIERPILFSGPMVRAILDGKKTQTRRVVKGNFPPDQFIREKSGSGYGWNQANWQGNKSMWLMTGPVGIARDAGYDTQVACPYGKPGDRLWIKTGYTTRYDHERNETHWKTEGGWITTHGQAMSKTGKPKRDGGHPGRFMPNWLSQEFRLPVLEITDIRVQRLQKITEEDADREGARWKGHRYEPCTAKDQFAILWDKLNATRGYGWDANPWVWSISFQRVN